MATPDGNATTSTPADSTTTPIIPAPIAANDQRVCFICLLTDTEDAPDAVWVNPCPCTLEAHQHCLLRWIAEMEVSPNQTVRGGLKCPACKAPIAVEEPRDTFIALRDRLYRLRVRMSPFLLGVLVTGSSVAGSAWYGWNAANVFAGPEVVTKWMGESRRALPWLDRKMWMLSAVGPVLVLMRWFPALGPMVAAPVAVWYSGCMARGEDLLGWPPSPQSVIVLAPTVQLVYARIMYTLFGRLERRLNRALRGQPEAEEEAALREGAQPAARAAADHNEEEPGLLRVVLALGRAVVELFLFDAPGEAQLEVEVNVDEDFALRVGPPGNDDAVEEAGVHGRAEELGDVWEDGFQILPQPAEEQEQQQQQPPAHQPAQQAPPLQPQQPPNQHNRRNNNNNNNHHQPRPDANEPSYLALIINSIVTPLLLPAISYGMGELIRTIAPPDWVTPQPWRWRRARPTGLLQQQWGRSVVGGCLFVVLRDALALYTKYRRVQVKSRRRVRNVERRREGEGARGS
ncbi:hypothetical protein VTI74DRAFT_4592 [Chaetomium olivicolor]